MRYVENIITMVCTLIFKQVRLNLTIGQLIYKREVLWLNPPEELGKGWRKGSGPEVLCFGMLYNTILCS